MAVYFVLLAVSAASGIAMCGLSEKKEGHMPAVYCICMGLALTLVSSLRLSVGYDYNLYAGWYYDLNFRGFEELGGLRQEKGFMYPLKILNILFSDYPAAFVLISLMIYPPLMYFIYKYSDDPWISVAAFFGAGLFFNSMNFMRQFIAAIICAYAFRYVEKGVLWRFWGLVIFAGAFHRSALFMLPCAALVYIGWNYVTLGISLAISAAAYVFSQPVLEFITKYVYTSYDITVGREIVNGLPPMYAVMYGALFIAAFALRNRMKGDEKERRTIVWCCFFSFFFELIGTKHGIVSRMSLLFFIPAVCLGVPKIFAALYELAGKKGRAAGYAAAAAVIMLLTGCMGMLLGRNYNGVVPYRTVLSRESGYEE